MTDDTAFYSVWLAPDEPVLSELQVLVQEFARVRSAPSFLPHLTLLGDLPVSQAKLAQILSQHAPRIPTQELTVSGVTVGDSFFKSIYLQLSCPPQLSAVQSALARAFPTTANPGRFDPHVSMIYGAVDASMQQETHAILQRFIGSTLRFERMQLVRSSQNTPVIDWQVLKEFALPNRPESVY